MKVPKGEEAIELQVKEIQKFKVELQRRQVEEIQDRQLFDAGTTGKPAGYQKKGQTKHKKIYYKNSKKGESRRNRGLKNVSVFMLFFAKSAPKHPVFPKSLFEITEAKFLPKHM